MGLWRLTSSKIFRVSQQTENSGKLMSHLSWKAGKIHVPAWGQTEGFHLYQERLSHFVLFRFLFYLIKPKQTREDNLPIQMIVSSRNSLSDTPRIMFDQLLVPCGPVRLTYKINHYISLIHECDLYDKSLKIVKNVFMANLWSCFMQTRQ